MTAMDNSLSFGRLAELIKLTLLVMLGRRPVEASYDLSQAGVWQAIWASMIFTFLVAIFPGMQNGFSLLAANMLMQLVAILVMVLLFAMTLRTTGLEARVCAFIVPFLWIENVQHLFSGLVQNLVIVTGDATLLILITPLIFWSVYWLWRVGRDQLGRGGWFATGLLFMSFMIDAVMFMFVQNRVQLPTG